MRPEELSTLPEPARRYLRASIAPDAPPVDAAAIRMRGSIRLGRRWLPFRASERLAPHTGFVWSARVGGVLTGSDHLVDGDGGMHWALLGRWPVLDADGPDVARSGAGRAAGEAVWLPTTLLPSAGVEWRAESWDVAVARLTVGGEPFDLRCTVDGAGRVLAVDYLRWGDPHDTGDWQLRPFHLTATAWDTFDGCTVPSRGSVGWGGEEPFFRYELLEVRPEAVVLVGATG